MKNNASSVYALFLIIGDFLALLAAFLIAYVLRVKVDPRPLIEQIPGRAYMNAVVAVLPLWILIHAFIGLYDRNIYEKRFREFGRLLVGSFIGILVVIGYDFVTNGRLIPARLVPVYGLFLGFGLLLLFRSLLRAVRTMLFTYNIGINNVLIIGDTPRTDELIRTLSDSRHTGYRVLGVVGKQAHDVASFATFEEALEKLKKHDIHGIIQTELYRDQVRNSNILTYAHTHHVSYRFVPGNTELFIGNMEVGLFQSIPVIAVHQTALIGWGRVVKRLFDIVVAALLLVVTAPLMVLIAVLIKLFDPSGPVFFRQTRLTRFDRKFRVFKFRTQYHKYDGTTPEEAFKLLGKPELAKTYRENGDYLPNDPRVTRIGRFLRKTSLDELPQLFNVLKGELSMVGPRALIPEELAAYTQRHAILSVKSGLTGLAQVSGRRDISYDERRKLDMYYAQNWSFWLDTVILIKTVGVILSGSGAK